MTITGLKEEDSFMALEESTSSGQEGWYAVALRTISAGASSVPPVVAECSVHAYGNCVCVCVKVASSVCARIRATVGILFQVKRLRVF